MGRAIGVFAAERIAVALVENNQIISPIYTIPEDANETEYLIGIPTEEIVALLTNEIERIRNGSAIDAIGVAFPGIIRHGIVEESPNLQQVKGQNLAAALSYLIKEDGSTVPVRVVNDADAMAAGIAATRGHLDRMVRVWTLGMGIGFGQYPLNEGVGEGGHSVVSLDPRERYCGCGGLGHLEGIMGNRAMRLRFLDLEPEEIFAEAAEGDERCKEFVSLWHHALAAATATNVHYEGMGKFYITGINAKYVQTNLIDQYVHEMVKMSPLQGSTFEVISTTDEIAIIGAAVGALQKT